MGSCLRALDPFADAADSLGYLVQLISLGTVEKRAGFGAIDTVLARLYRTPTVDPAPIPGLEYGQ
jgi:hypothetical protein